jgi:hypothetical protein
MNARRLAAWWLLAACTSAACAQPVQGDVAAIGFQAPNGFVVRLGQWIPIQVRLTVQGTQLFSGELRAEGIDLDGDRVAYVQRPVIVTPEAGAERTWCYMVANSLNELPANIDILSADGVLVGKLPLPQCDSVRNDDLLVLDISRPSAVRRGVLMTPGRYRNIVVAQLPNGANDLPDRWWGLEAVDVIFWDQPAPTSISLAQLDALVDWVRNGGQLVVGVGASWSAIRKSALAAIMPLEGEGPVVELKQLDSFARRVGLPAWQDDHGILRQPIAATTARPAAGALATINQQIVGSPDPVYLITMRLVGSGRVVATAASLRDLGVAPIDEGKFYAALLDLNTYSADFQKQQESTGWAANVGYMEATSLYQRLVGPVSFAKRSALYAVTAFLFVAAYVVVATLASWWWLRRRKLTHLSWSVFAGFAVAASVLSLVTVSALRGLSRVAALSVLDLEAGASTARGPCLFGYRSALRQVVGLSLPGEGDFLRPLARPQQISNAYVTPARYAGVPARARLEDVLMRATLKQFEGYWHGELDGTIRADLVVRRGPQREEAGRLTPASWIANELAVDIADGYLLFIDPRQADPAAAGKSVPARAAGLTTWYDPALSEVPPALNVLAVRLPPIPAGKQISGLGAELYREADQRYKEWARLRPEERQRKDKFDLPTLRRVQQAWAGSSFIDAAVQAALLASTRNFYLSSSGEDFNRPGTPITTEALPDLDITHWLRGGDAGVAVLLCWSHDPGPARLYRDGKPMKSSEGLTLYRVRVPMRYEGSPPRPGGEP